ncbi:MAG: hypothetical protein J7L96_11085, partial [Bacteroidales bacterium]|nr:hypothetical protein [Bacteroidales bacterium]
MRLIGLLSLSLAIISLNACKPSADTKINDEIIVTGTVQNLSDTTITVNYDEYALLSSTEKAEMYIDTSGQFRMTISSEHPVRCYMSLGKVAKNYKFTITQVNGIDSTMGVGSFDFKPVYLYLQPGDDINMTCDFNNIEESLKFTGKGADNNTFMNLEEYKFN